MDDDTLRGVIATASIDDLIDNDGLQIMVLSMRRELTEDQRQNDRRPSDLVTYLMQHYDNSDIVYSRLVYTLQILGHRRYGHRAIRKLEASRKSNNDRPFDIDFHIKVDKNEFLLHQYLAVACRVIPPDCWNNFIAYCSNEILGGHNPSMYKTPCQVLTKMLEEDKVTPKNHEEVMEEALINAGVPEQSLEKYQEICSQIESKSFHTRSRCSTRTSDGLHRRHINVPQTFQVGSPVPQQLRGQDVEDVELSDRMCNKRRYCILAGTSVCVFLGLILCISLVLLGSHVSEVKKTNKPLSLLCRENSSMILTEVNHQLTGSLTVTEDTRHVGDFQRAVAVYRLASPCSSIPTHRETETIVNGTDFSLINGTTFYALSGSSIQFKICATTNATAPDIERLELILQKNSIPTIIDFFHVGTDDEWQCKESKLDLKEPGYYTINFFPPTHEARFVFNATYNVREVDAEQLQERASENITLHRDQYSHVFSLTFGAIHSCFVATIKDNPNTSKENVHVKLTFKPQTSGYVIGGVLLPILFIIIVITVVVFMYVLTCHLKTA